MNIWALIGTKVVLASLTKSQKKLNIVKWLVVLLSILSLGFFALSISLFFVDATETAELTNKLLINIVEFFGIEMIEHKITAEGIATLQENKVLIPSLSMLFFIGSLPILLLLKHFITMDAVVTDKQNQRFKKSLAKYELKKVSKVNKSIEKKPEDSINKEKQKILLKQSKINDKQTKKEQIKQIKKS